jgi:hypothetical protein
MTPTTVIGIDPTAQSDGGLVLRMRNESGQDTTAVIPATLVAEIQSALQGILVERVSSAASLGELTTGVALPHLTIEQIAIADHSEGTTLCGHTLQMGWVSLEASGDVLREMKQKIDVVLSSSPVKH